MPCTIRPTGPPAYIYKICSGLRSTLLHEAANVGNLVFLFVTKTEQTLDNTFRDTSLADFTTSALGVKPVLFRIENSGNALETRGNTLADPHFRRASRTAHRILCSCRQFRPLHFAVRELHLFSQFSVASSQF